MVDIGENLTTLSLTRTSSYAKNVSIGMINRLTGDDLYENWDQLIL